MQKDIKQSLFFPQPTSKVWEYLTKAELLETWLAKTNFLPVLHHRFQVSSPVGNDAQCEVLEIKPEELLVYSWQKNSAQDNQPFRSVVTWILESEEEGTQLLLTHTGFIAEDDVISHTNGWNACLKLMTDLLDVPD
jgi:uncharacterized protein YndB with AHSA1/START domain